MIVEAFHLVSGIRNHTHIQLLLGAIDVLFYLVQPYIVDDVVLRSPIH